MNLRPNFPAGSRNLTRLLPAAIAILFSAPLPAQFTPASGGLSLVSPASGVNIPMCLPGKPCRGDVWYDVPGLSTNVYSRAGDNLTITISAEINAPDTVWLRALVDGAGASPSDVTFKTAGDFSDGVRSFTFVKDNMPAGRHTVQIQWLAHQTWPSAGPTPGSAPEIGDRTLSVNSAAPASGTVRLAVAAGVSSADIVKTTPTWEDIPGLSTTIATSETTNFEITFSAETGVDRGRFFVRALLDGQADSDVLFDSQGNSAHRGTRSFTFVRKSVPAGNHTITVQWSAMDTGASIRIGDRTVAVLASRWQGEGLKVAGAQSAPVSFTSAGWSDISDTSVSFNTTAPSSNVRVTFSSEMNVQGGRMFLRALVDGQPANPSDVIYVRQGPEWRSQSFVFIEKNLQPGGHSVKIQALVDTGATAQVADRSMSALFKRRQGDDFAQPFPRLISGSGGSSDNVAQAGDDERRRLKPRSGSFPLLVICFDPGRADQALSQEQITNQFLGNDGGPSVMGWFQENTDGRYGIGSVTFLGCSDAGWFKPPVGREGNYYWTNSAFPQMWEDALKAADPYFDFHAYDRNGDNRITADELAVAIVRPQNGTDGYFRTASASLDGNSQRLDIDILDVYLSSFTNDATRRLNVGLVAHEASHAVLNAADMYDNAGNLVPRPWTHSLMDSHGNANHLDPFHKLKTGLLKPDVAEINEWVTQTVTLGSVERYQQAMIIYDPARKDREYFLIESRWGGLAGGANYDTIGVPQGVAVWHIVEDQDLADQYRPAGGSAFGKGDWGRLSVRLIQKLLAAGNGSGNLRWANGSDSGMSVTLMSAPDEFVTVRISKSGTTPSVPDLTVSKSHTGDFTQAQTGATYTIQVSNSGTASTLGTVQVTDSLPSGLTATAIAGTGWVCNLAALTCTRNDVLSANGAYPPITLTVNVAANAAATVTNTATVSGGGESNTANNVASDMTTISAGIQPPVITAQPADTFVCSGQPAVFSVTATGSGLTYQWRRNGADIPGATGSSYTIASATTGHAGTYSVVVRNSAGSVTSSNATLTVNTAVTITVQPASLTRAPGQSASFSVGATGTSVRYQWRGPDGGNIPGATSSTYTIPSVTSANAGPYYAVVYNGCGQVNSSTAVLTVTTADAGNNAYFNVQSIPTTMKAGQPYNVAIRFTNSGSSTWTRAGGYKLTSQRPQGNMIWGLSSVDIPPALIQVSPNGVAAFNFTVTAPSTPGTYMFEWRMTQNGVGFGDFSPALSVSVTP